MCVGAALGRRGWGGAVALGPAAEAVAWRQRRASGGPGLGRPDPAVQPAVDADSSGHFGRLARQKKPLLLPQIYPIDASLPNLSHIAPNLSLIAC